MSEIIEFNNPAEYFEEAFPVGNSFMGGMYYGNPIKSKLSLNLDSLWSGNGKYKGKTNAGKYFGKVIDYVNSGKISKAAALLKKRFYGYDSEGYLPLGNLFIEAEAKDFTNYNRLLDLNNGIVKSSYNTENLEISETVFCSYKDRVLAYQIKSDKPFLNRKIYFKSSFPSQMTTADGVINCSGSCPDGCNPIRITNDGDTIKYSCSFKIKTDGEIFGDSAINVCNASYIEIYFYGDTTYYRQNLSEYAVNFHLNEMVEKGFDAVFQSHIADYKSLYMKSKISIAVDEMSEKAETLFNFGKYLMISSSRGKTLPANLQGIWSESKEPIWYCAYTMNINLEMNYWGTEKVSLGECTEPLIDFIGELKKSGEQTAGELFGSSGWCAFHNSDIWHMSSPVGAEHDGDPGNYAWFAGTAGWLCLPVFEHYLYSLDKNYLLNTALPIIEGACKFYLDTLSFKNNEYTFIPGASPENTYITDGKQQKICAGTAMDCSIIKGLFLNYIKCCDELEIKPFMYKRVKEVVKKIRNPIVGSDGRILEWDKDYEEYEKTHRHISHLYFNFPESLNSDGKYDDAVKKSLDERGLGGTGWSIAWKINQFARLHDGETAYKLIKRYLTPVIPSAKLDYSNGGGTYPNFFCAHPPFQIDGNFGVMSGIAEMLMQDHGDKIELLPAIPPEWKNGEVSGFSAKGGYSVDFKWEDGKITEYKIGHKQKEKCNVLANGNEKSVSTNRTIICK